MQATGSFDPSSTNNEKIFRHPRSAWTWRQRPRKSSTRQSNVPWEDAYDKFRELHCGAHGCWLTKDSQEMLCPVNLTRTLAGEFLHRDVVLRPLLPVEQDQRQGLRPAKRKQKRSLGNPPLQNGDYAVCTKTTARASQRRPVSASQSVSRYVTLISKQSEIYGS